MSDDERNPPRLVELNQHQIDFLDACCAFEFQCAGAGDRLMIKGIRDAFKKAEEEAKEKESKKEEPCTASA